jgi:hypothetical protein
MMTKKHIRVPVEVELVYHGGKDIPGRVYRHTPVDPQFTAELTLTIRFDDVADPRLDPLGGRRPQVDFAGTPRALEAFGTYLIAMARLETTDPSPHTHFEEVQNFDGGTVHLIVRRQTE